MKTFTIACGLVLAAVLPGAGIGSAAEWLNLRINTDQTGELQNEQQIVVNPTDPQNLVAVWRDFRLGYRQVGYGYTMDAGRTWVNPGLFVNPHYTRDSDPALTVSAEGTFYAMLLAYNGNFYEPNGMLMYRSLDNGQSWEERGFAVNGVPGVFEDKELIACDRTGSPYHGRIYMVWARFFETNVYCVSSGDEGLTWTSERLVSDSPSLQFPIPAVGADGSLYVAWTYYGDSSLRIDRSTDGGLTFGPDRLVTYLDNPYPTLNGNIEAPAHPAMDVDISDGPFGGRIYIAYIDRPAGPDFDIWIRHSDNHGVSWSDARRINDDAIGNGRDQFHPWITVDNAGIVSVVWLDRRHDPSNLQWHCYISQSFDGGQTWTANQQVSTVPSDPGSTDLFPPDESDFQAERLEKMARGPEIPGWVRRAREHAEAGGATPRDQRIKPQPDQAPSRAGRIGEYIGIASYDGFATVVWTDTREGNQDSFGGVEDTGAGIREGDLPPALPQLRIAPNPAAGPLQLSYTVPADGRVTIELFDVAGRRLRTFVDRSLRSGTRQFVWDHTDQAGQPVAPGSYWIRFRAPGADESVAVLLPQ